MITVSQISVTPTERRIPKQIILETSAVCNLVCKGCPINTYTGGARFMDLEFFRSVIERIDFPTTVIPWMNGESLLHPQIEDIWEIILEHRIPSYLTTNGMIWNERLFRRLMEPGSSCYQIIISHDGLFQSSVSTARPGADLTTIEETIRGLLEMRSACPESKTQIAVKICQRGQDWEEIENYIDHWVRVVDFVIEGKILEQRTEPGTRTYPCQYFDNNFMVIRADGTLVLCAYHPDIVNGGKNPLFKLDEKMPLLEAYNAKIYQSYRTGQEAGIFCGPCDTCGFAYTGMGMDGSITLRQTGLTLSYRRDYYNHLYSRKDVRKNPIYYARGSAAEIAK